MKKQTLHFIFVIVFAVLLSIFLPWWSVMVAAIIAAVLIPLKKGAVFFVPFIAITLLWMIEAFYLSKGNDFILAKKISVLLPLEGNIYLLILLTGIIGGLAAGFAGIFGKQISLLLKP